MTDKSIIDPFYTQIQGEITRIEHEVHRYNLLFYCIRITQIVLTAAITVLAGMAYTRPHYVTYILVFGTIVTATTAMDTLFQIDTKRSTCKVLLFELRTIRTEFVYKQMQSGKVDDLRFREQLFEQYRKLNAYARGLIGEAPDNNPGTSSNHVQGSPASNHAGVSSGS